MYQININSQVNAKKIRRELYNGEEHLIVPSFTLPSNVVMKGVLYPESEINAHFHQLEGKPAPLGHPTLHGIQISAHAAEAVNQSWVGAWNRNVRKEGNRIYVEKWINLAVASRSVAGRELIRRCEAWERGDPTAQPIHTSIAVWVAYDKAPAHAGYESVARFKAIDHDAILLDEPGAATPDNGVGMMVNSADAVPMAANRGILGEETNSELEKRLRDAVRAKWPEYWIAEFTSSHVVVDQNDSYMLYAYTDNAGTISIEEPGVAVERETSWVKRNLFTNALASFFRPSRASARGEPQQEKAAMALTPEEKADLIKEFGALITNSLAPLAQKLETVETQQKAITDNLTEQTKKDETVKRAAVAKIHGDLVANSLSGEALDSLYAKCTDKPEGQQAAPFPDGIGAPAIQTNNADRATTLPQDFKTYFGG